MVIGITGGIGSGKSLFSKYFNNELDDSILIMTDDLAKEQQKIGNISYNAIVHEFGVEILNEDKTINSKKLGDIVFNDSSKLEKLNEITHPNVINEIKNIISNNKNKDIIIESALLFDTTLYQLCDKTVLIDTTLEKRMYLLKTKRNYTEDKIKKIIEKQNSYKDKVDCIILNDSNEEDLEKKANTFANCIKNTKGNK